MCGSDNINTNIKCNNCGSELTSVTKMIDSSSYKKQFTPLQSEKLTLFSELYMGIIFTIVGLIFSSLVSYVLFKGEDAITKIMCLPFLVSGLVIAVCGIAAINKGISTKKNIDAYIIGELDPDKVIKSERTVNNIWKIANNIYLFVFLAFWFGMLIAGDISAIKDWSDGGDLMFCLSLPFWLIGFFILPKFKK